HRGTITPHTREPQPTAYHRHSTSAYNNISRLGGGNLFGPGAHVPPLRRRCNVNDYLKVRLAAFTTSAKTWMSASIRFLNSSPVGPPGFTAICLSPSCTPGSASALPSSIVSLFTIGAGVPAGRKKPLQRCVSTSGNPASAILGTSGSSGERSEPVTASA